MGLVHLVGEVWFRALLPVVVLVLFELLTRYLAKGENQTFSSNDYFLALPLLGAAIAAFPGLIALRAERHPSAEEITVAAFVLIALVFSASWLVVFDKRTLRRHREDGGGSGWRRIFWATFFPDLLAAICLAMVFAYAPS